MAKAKKQLYTRTRARIIFYTLMMALPIAQIAICYVAVNANMFIAAFQKYEYSTTSIGFDISFSTDNFRVAWNTFMGSGDMIKRSFSLFLVNMFVGFPLALIFSFYIYKGYAFSGFFKVFLFLPQIISGLIFALLFKYVANPVYIQLVKEATGATKVLGLLTPENPDAELTTLIIYNVWVSFGVKTLLFSGSMSGIDQSIVESAQLDGVNLVQEFIHITLPLIYGTVVQFLLIQVVAVFTDGMHILSFYSQRGTHVATLGYFLFVQAQNTDYVIGEKINYTIGQLSAFGIILTAIVLPMTLVIRKLLNKFGPSVD